MKADYSKNKDQLIEENKELQRSISELLKTAEKKIGEDAIPKLVEI